MLANFASQLTIRLLNSRDGSAYQQLRLQSLQENPRAFLSTYENEKKLHEQAFGEYLDSTYHPPHFGYFGAFIDGKLVGYVQVSENFLDKQKHLATLNNVYVSPNFRRQGIASQLFEYVFSLLQTTESIERLYLSCTAQNKPAYNFYKRQGFQRYGVRTRAIKWQDPVTQQNHYDDEVEMVKILPSGKITPHLMN